ncbi:PREDICTED: proteasome inhibitor PI31 subunit [Nanorana parkeri]|uniref:proteasome inhibitor PI31 subunit n=1 Tax=Nanorana parkeri TaxID=125878 RepID=UPI000854830D|nr:PREDICTED: proteasome inhibitor PI31 subunit [Nanorana parkeri]
MASPGLELLFALAAPEITEPQDPLICFIHWELISQGFRCLGKGEKAGDDEKESERLPDGWASNKELYTLRYGNSKSKILCKALKVDITLLVNIMDMKTEKLNNVTLIVGDFIDKAHLKDFSRVFKKKKELKRHLDTELMLPLLGPKVTSGKLEKERDKPPDYFTPSVPPGSSAPQHTPRSSRENPSGNIPYGAADLDPLGGHTGGMIFDPFGPGSRPRPDPLVGLPPGAVPPGARFDPFGPPGSRRPGPDPDHLPPPGYDDMFM